MGSGIVVKASLHTPTCDSKLLFGRYVEGAATSGSIRDHPTSRTSGVHTVWTSCIALTLIIGAECMSIHCMHITTIEAICSGQQTDNILFSPAINCCSERTRPMCDEGRTGLANTVGKRETKLGLKELFDVWSTDILRLFNLHNAKNL